MNPRLSGYCLECAGGNIAFMAKDNGHTAIRVNQFVMIGATPVYKAGAFKRVDQVMGCHKEF